MKTTMVVMTAAIFASSHLFAQTTKPKAVASPPSPLQVIGKTFEDCEKLIGKPSSIEDPKGEEKAFSRYYKASLPSITKIELVRGPDGAWDRPISSTVNIVTYYFPKGMVKTWKEAFALIGIKSEGATQEVLGADGANSIVRVEAPDFPKGWIHIQWTPSASTLKMPERYRHPNEDSLSFSGKLPTDKNQSEKPTVK